jgi:hypothetical protein
VPTRPTALFCCFQRMILVQFHLLFRLHFDGAYKGKLYRYNSSNAELSCRMDTRNLDLQNNSENYGLNVQMPENFEALCPLNVLVTKLPKWRHFNQFFFLQITNPAKGKTNETRTYAITYIRTTQCTIQLKSLKKV